jgi:tetratricopeptide (TPR) repeat protein
MRMNNARSVSALIVCAVGLAPALVLAQTRPTEQSHQGSATIDRLEQWIEAVRAHVIGEADSYATIAALWTHDDVAAMFPYLEALLQLVEAPTREDQAPSPQVRLARPAPVRSQRALYRLSTVEIGNEEVERLRLLASLLWVQADPNRLLIRGAMLHTDVAMLTKVRGQTFAPNSSSAPTVRRLGQSVDERVVVRAPDADFRGIEYGEVHWDVARTLLDRIRPDPAADALVRQWYRATGAYFAREGAIAEAKPHFTHALRVFPKDAQLPFAYGCLQAGLASPGVQEFVAATHLPRGMRMDIESAGEQLRRASELFERALAADPALVEARVRLARVRFDQGRPREALSMLQDVAPTITDDIVSYYAQLVLGDAAAALGQRDVAGAGYRRAAMLFPSAQTPRLALSLLARSGGNAAGALTALAPIFSLPDDPMERPDPWWAYDKGEGRYASTLMADLIRAIPPAQ